MYGPLVLGEEVKFKDILLRLEGGERYSLYIRSSPWGDIRKRLVGVEKLIIHPAPPIYLPVPGLFSHIYIPISPEIYVDVGEETFIDLYVLPDIAVSHVERSTRYIDIIPLKTPKMAAYGGSADGILSRYLFPAGDEDPKVRIPIRITNKCGEPISISKIVFPISFYNVYYLEGSSQGVCNSLNVELECDVAIIYPDKEAPSDGYKPIPIESTEVLMEKLGLDMSSFKRMFNVDKSFIMDRGL